MITALDKALNDTVVSSIECELWFSFLINLENEAYRKTKSSYYVPKAMLMCSSKDITSVQ